MPTISLVSPKGGVGKTTAAVVLATQIAQKGKAVVLIGSAYKARQSHRCSQHPAR
ncbi:MAG: AAA family ATPase [Amaricoccus sp.]|uniref:ParA family protein n=1 Tax=Amaricoccus sp. TaxID=1872485 RepID=UPI0033147ED5